jgi:uncharacterized phage-associated protein
MPTVQQREKLLNAIIFFVENTRKCHKLKLFKLLHFFDFQVFRETGKSPTGLHYFAWEMGPVPKALWLELKQPAADLNTHVLVLEVASVDPDFQEKRLDLKARKPFDESKFTRRELRIMKDLAFKFLELSAKQMTQASHERDQPWFEVYEVRKRHQAEIPYLLALDGSEESLTEEEANAIANEQKDAEELLG